MNCREMLADIRSVGRLTQAEIARELGMTQSHISKIERGEVREMKGTALLSLRDLRAKVIRRSLRKNPRLSHPAKKENE